MMIETNILDFNSRLQQRQEQEESQQAMEYFTNNILPYLTLEDKIKLQEAQYNSNRFNNVLSRILLRMNS